LTSKWCEAARLGSGWLSGTHKWLSVRVPGAMRGLLNEYKGALFTFETPLASGFALMCMSHLPKLFCLNLFVKITSRNRNVWL